MTLRRQRQLRYLINNTRSPVGLVTSLFAAGALALAIVLMVLE